MDDGMREWCERTTKCAWPDAEIARIDPLRGDLSVRRFWRLHLAGDGAPASAILIDLGPHDLPGYVRALNLVPKPPSEPPWLTVHRFLSSLGAPVPTVYSADHGHRLMLIEDVGDVSLVDAVRARPSDTADLFRLAVELLLLIHVEGTRALPGDLLPATIAYDGRLFRWEFKEFIDLGCVALGTHAIAEDLIPELDALAAELGELARVFSHRDFHGQNLSVQQTGDGPKIRVIDFQDALMAPAAQDLAVLLTTRDMDEIVRPDLEQRLLDFYYTGLLRRGSSHLSVSEFHRSYRLCVLQHAIKMIGRFLMFEQAGKTGYQLFVPHLILQARRILIAIGADFPKLAETFGAAKA
jgi:aminoglycoside/choline kinase family phosphotransferase